MTYKEPDALCVHVRSINYDAEAISKIYAVNVETSSGEFTHIQQCYAYDKTQGWAMSKGGAKVHGNVTVVLK